MDILTNLNRDPYKQFVMTEVLISPMSLVGMTIYHTKNLPYNIGASYGLLYAVQ